MIGAKYKTDEHKVNNFVFLKPTLQSHSSDKSILYDGVWLKPWPYHINDYLNCRLIAFSLQYELNLFEQVFFIYLSEFVKVKILSYKIHNNFFRFRTIDNDF